MGSGWGTSGVQTDSGTGLLAGSKCCVAGQAIGIG